MKPATAPDDHRGLRGPNAEAGLRGPNAEAGLRGPNAEAGVSLRVEQLRHEYRSGDGRLRVLDGVDLAVGANGYAAISGPSGAGKTTLLSILGGLERAQAGRVEVGGRDIAALAGDELAAYRRATVGFVFQHFGLLDTLTAAENVELAASLSGTPARRRRARAAEVLAALGLANRGEHRPPALSGGERQRVAIARALVNRPRLLLADEPTGNLDEDAAAMVVGLLEDVRRDHGCTLVVVTHNRALAARAEVRYRIDDGRLLTT